MWSGSPWCDSSNVSISFQSCVTMFQEGTTLDQCLLQKPKNFKKLPFCSFEKWWELSHYDKWSLLTNLTLTWKTLWLDMIHFMIWLDGWFEVGHTVIVMMCNVGHLWPEIRLLSILHSFVRSKIPWNLMAVTAQCFTTSSTAALALLSHTELHYLPIRPWKDTKIKCISCKSLSRKATWMMSL